MKWFTERFARNPFAWILLAAFCVAEYNNYMRGKELTEVCDLLDRETPAFEMVSFNPQRVRTICSSRGEGNLDF